MSERLKVNWSLAPGYVRPEPVVDRPQPPGVPDHNGDVWVGMRRIRGKMQITEGDRKLNYGKRQRIAVQMHIGTENFSFRRWGTPRRQVALHPGAHVLRSRYETAGPRRPAQTTPSNQVRYQ